MNVSRTRPSGGPPAADPPGASAPDADGARPRYIERARVRALYAQSWTSIAVNCVLALTVAVVLDDSLPRPVLLPWLGAILLVTGIRGWLVFRFLHRRPDDWCEVRWRQAAVAGAAGGGICWGITGVWFMPFLAEPMQLMLMLVLAGLAGGAIAILGGVFTAYVAFAVPALLPAGGAMLASDRPVEQAIGWMALVYCAAMLASARQQHRSVGEVLGLDFENGRLVHDLSEANWHSRRVNARLREEVREREQMQAAYQLSEERFRDFADTAADWFYELDPDLRFTYVSERHAEFTGQPGGEILGHTPREVFADSGEKLSTLTRHFDDLDQRRSYRVDLRFTGTDGETRVFEYAGKPLLDEEGHFLGYRGTGRDVTEPRALSRRLSYQATHDPLTDLLNRKAFETRLEFVMQTARADGVSHTVLYLDLDQIKLINDTCGHVAGDELLRQVSALLLQHTRSADTVARLGGDEFGIILGHCPLERSIHVAESIRRGIADMRFVWEGSSFALGTSIGVIGVDGDSENLSEIMRAADAACYVAKDRGRNRIHVYHSDDEDLARRHGEMQWTTRVTAALENDWLELVVQPIVATTDDGSAGAHFEALVRLREPGGPSISPGAFLPAVERFGIASRLDRWVVHTALAWLDRDHPYCERIELCSVNLSGQSITEESFLEEIVERVSCDRVAADRLCFEITETAAITNLSAATRFIEALRAHGVKFALDDFGSGLSSFGYLKTLPVDFLKIDGMFVKDIVDDPVDLAMVRSIHEMGKVVGKQTIAEFVENDAILAELRAIGVDFVQGYGIGRPMPIEALLGDGDAENPTAEGEFKPASAA